MMEEREIFINNLKVNYKIAGEEGFSLSDVAKKRSPILVLHGWGKGSDSWVRVQELLAMEEYLVIVPDMPGFGKSDNPPFAWNIDNYVEWFNNFLLSLNLKKVFLLTHSFGGRVAIKFAVKYPEKIFKLILYEAAGIKHQKTFFQFLLFLISKLGKIFSFLPFYSFFQKVFYKFFVRKNDYLQAHGVMKETFKKIIEEDLTLILSQISTPTLIVWGEKDKVTPLSDSYLMKKEIPNSELKIIPEMGHAFHHEAPEKLAQIVTHFLQS